MGRDRHAAHADVVDLREVDITQTTLVGGKGAHLGELTRIEGVRVPPGFCVTTVAYERIVAQAPSFVDLLDPLARVDAEDHAAIRTLSAEIRRTVEALALPDDLTAAVTRALAGRDAQAAYAVRSSATAEDAATASFAGQHDTYLHVTGPESILEHVRRCWASLFTERAVSYRLRNGGDHRAARMAVVVQRMVDADAAGVLFTADPVTGNRTVARVDAVPGLGEGLVAGHAAADSCTVRGGAVVERAVAAQRADGWPVLSDEQAVRLAALGRRIEAHLGRPQDIEWCLVDDRFAIVQSRPITTLFPVPASGGEGNRVYVSVGHQQMMTDPMRPLGLSMFQLTAGPPMHEAGGRLFVDVTPHLTSPATRARILDGLGRSDPLIRDALRSVVDREGFLPPDPGGPSAAPPPGEPPDPVVVADLVAGMEAAAAVLEREIRERTGPELFDFILADVQELKRLVFDPRSHRAIMAGMEATWWLNEHLEEWLGERGAADTLSQSVPGNVTSQMGLALLDVADVVRPHPEVVAFLEGVEDDAFLDAMDGLEGGPQARDAIRDYLDRYGMRCVGEIDITRPRWAECPSALVPAILGNVRNAEPGAGPRRFERGRREAQEKADEILGRLRNLPDGERKAAETQEMIDRLAAFVGYREYPKFHIVSRYLAYKRALMREAERLAADGVLHDAQGAYDLRFEELREAVRTRRVDRGLIAQRRAAFAAAHALVPPRVITSDGEILTGSYRREGLPDGVLVGLPVSRGTVEGRARVVLDMADADLGPGDILVTTHTDPSWSPLFVAATGLVTEVGGQMTHGAVIAREYGLPAVVGVQDATRLIRDGQRIRVCGAEGSVEILA